MRPHCFGEEEGGAVHTRQQRRGGAGGENRRERERGALTLPKRNKRAGTLFSAGPVSATS